VVLDVVGVATVVLDVELVDVVPPPPAPHAAGAGAFRRRSCCSSLRCVRPPNSAQ